MLYNYLKVAFRNLLKNKIFSFINILGLSIGLTCGMLILLWTRSELEVDSFHKNDRRLFVIYQRQFQDGKIDAGYYTPGLLAEELKRTTPEVEEACGFGFSVNTVGAANQIEPDGSRRLSKNQRDAVPVQLGVIQDIYPGCAEVLGPGGAHRTL